MPQREHLSVPTFTVPMSADRTMWDEQLLEHLEVLDPDWIVCAGFMRILGPRVLGRFPGRIVNSHPSLLPAFPGAGAVRSSLEYGVRVSGCTVHLVDSGVDTGPILAQQPVFVEDDDDESTLHERIKQIERVLLVDVLERLIDGGVIVTGRSVEFR
jgi:phosphoribosylglycinamide formyltransferase-1